MQHADENGSLRFPKFNFEKDPRALASNEGKNPFPAPTRPSQASLVTPRAPKSPCAAVCRHFLEHITDVVFAVGTRAISPHQQFHLGVFPEYTRQGVCSASHFRAEYFSMHGGRRQ
jgi:hypothetical protein